MIDAGRFFVPGPTEVRPEVLDAMRRPLIFHRSPAMREIMARSIRRLSGIFGTGRPVHVVTGSGTAAMDMVIRSGSLTHVLAIVHGDFGERFARIAEGCGRRVTRLVAEPGEVIPLETIREALVRGGVDTITVTHSETATGTLADVAAIAAIVREFPSCLLLVDAVSSAGAMPLDMDAWDAGAIVTASQKAMAMPPGLAFVAVSDRFLERARGTIDRGTYLDVLRYEEFTAKHESPTTPAVPLLFAMDRQLADIEAEGLDARYARHAAMAALTVAWGERMRGDGLDVSVVARPGARSASVTCFRSARAPDVLARMRALGYDLGGGQAPLTGTSFRVGHMGDHTPAGVEAMLGVLESALRTG